MSSGRTNEQARRRAATNQHVGKQVKTLERLLKAHPGKGDLKNQSLFLEVAE